MATKEKELPTVTRTAAVCSVMCMRCFFIGVICGVRLRSYQKEAIRQMIKKEFDRFTPAVREDLYE